MPFRLRGLASGFRNRDPDSGDFVSPPQSLEPAAFAVQTGGMAFGSTFGRVGFWLLAFLWLPAGILGQAAVRFPPAQLFLQHPAGPMSGGLDLLVSLLPAALGGLPLALGCRRLWRLGRRRSASATGIALGLVSVFAALVAGLLGPAAIVAVSAVLSLPVWVAAWWLTRRDRPH